MKFGLFIPQGWRQDLVGIDPALGHEAPPHAVVRQARSATNVRRAAWVIRRM